MLFRQLFDKESSTYTYLLASRPGGEALIIDPVRGEADKYARLFEELDVKLVYAIDTHVHADHVTALGTLRNTTDCVTLMGEQTKAECVSRRLTDGEVVSLGDDVKLTALYTPGHTDDSYSFLMNDRVFTGDTLLIRGTGRTDFQNGSARDQYDSLFGKLLKLPEDTLVYPAHDYKGWTVSTIGEEKRHNPRLQVDSVEAYVAIMDHLNLAHPKMMDIAVPANLACGLPPRTAPWEGEVSRARGFNEVDVRWLAGHLDDVRLVDVREPEERVGPLGSIADSIHVPFSKIEAECHAWDHEKPVAIICRSGGRSGIAAAKLEHLGFEHVASVAGGMLAWSGNELETFTPRGTCG